MSQSQRNSSPIWREKKSYRSKNFKTLSSLPDRYAIKKTASGRDTSHTEMLISNPNF